MECTPFVHVPRPIIVKCPNCGQMIKLDKRVESGKEFTCPKCATELMLPRGSVILFALSLLVIAGGVIVASLIGIALGIRTPYEAITFQGNPIPGLVFWVAVVLFLILAAIASARMKLHVVRLATKPK